MGLRQRLERFDGRHPRAKWGFLGLALLIFGVSLLFRRADQPPLATADDAAWWNRLVLGCTKCGHEWQYASGEEFTDAVRDAISRDDDSVGETFMHNYWSPLMCPKCGEAAGEVMILCPKCKKYYLYSRSARVHIHER